MARNSHILSFLLLVSLSPIVVAQDRTFTVGFSAGITHLNLSDVDLDGANDVKAWNNQGIPIRSFPSLKTSFMYSFKGSYRIDRDIALTFSFARSAHKVAAEYATASQELLLVRSLGFTDLTAGVLFHYPLYYDIVEGYLGGEVGLLSTFAHAEAFAARLVIIEEDVEVFPYVDTHADYTGKKTTFNVTAGATLRVFEPIFLRADVQYKFGNVGKMDGHVTRIDSEGDETTSIGFDFSGLLLTLGISVRF